MNPKIRMGVGILVAALGSFVIDGGNEAEAGRRGRRGCEAPPRCTVATSWSGSQYGGVVRASNCCGTQAQYACSDSSYVTSRNSWHSVPSTTNCGCGTGMWSQSTAQSSGSSQQAWEGQGGMGSGTSYSDAPPPPPSPQQSAAGSGERGPDSQSSSPNQARKSSGDGASGEGQGNQANEAESL